MSGLFCWRENRVTIINSGKNESMSGNDKNNPIFETIQWIEVGENGGYVLLNMIIKSKLRIKDN